MASSVAVERTRDVAAVNGIPFGAVAGRPLADRARTLALQAVVVIVAYHAYRFVRTLTEGSRIRAIDNSNVLLRFEDRIGLNIEQGVQSLVLGNQLLVDLVNRIYVFTFWPVVTGVLIALYLLDREHFRHYRNALFVSGAVGLVVFGLYPVAPPRMLDGFVDTVKVFSGSTEFARPGKFTNQFAAMPSFHVGWLVLAGMAARPLVPWRRMRKLLLVPGAAMSFTVMATANHYLIDAVFGVAVALGAFALSHRPPAILERRAERRRQP